MEVNKELIKHLAEVARIKLTDKETEAFIPQLKEILEAFKKLDELDTSKINPSFQPVKIRNLMREDKPGKCLTQDEALSLVKNKEEGYFKGPKAI
jgi:aspartyl-tRNA(Asn)/glutamyl-tRNA(Gln) amidotransferase subunit C